MPRLHQGAPRGVMPLSSRSCALRTSGTSRFEPEYSTENEYRDAFERLGHEMVLYQEGGQGFQDLIDDAQNGAALDFVLWTRTRDLANQGGDALQWEMLRTAGRAGLPVIGVHLDIWHGLQRATQVRTDPYFRGVDLLMTADGGHQREWEGSGVNHRWLLPAISERWLGLGEPRDEFRSKVAFVGSWQGIYHREAKHRHELINWLDRTFGGDVKFWPKRNAPAIRGRELNDLYASVDVVVGDSYLSPGGHYCSDRIPESLGRGAILLHPAVQGVNAQPEDPFDMPTWPAGDWAALKRTVDTLLGYDDGQRGSLRSEHVLQIEQGHTYTHRAQTIIDTLAADGML